MQIKIREGVIAKYCETHTITRAQLADALGVAITTIWRIEEGHVDPSPRFIASLMHETGQSFEALFSVDTEAATA